jgi:ferredoxin
VKDAGSLSLIQVKGTPAPYRPYYQPRDRNGKPVNFLKAKPETDADKCIHCGICAAVCTMGSINPDNVYEVPGICIKCNACVKKCPVDAKSFTDANYIYHMHELEAQYTRRAAPELFV